MSDWKCPECGKGYEDHPSLDVSHVTSVQVCGNRVIAPEGGDRHPKWQQVPPGTVIPAGQPYRVEFDGPGIVAHECIPDAEHTADGRYGPWFIDSSWKPPLVLPTTPTWGIAVGALTPRLRLGRWSRDGDIFTDHYGWWQQVPVEQVIDFIPLTDEQVARIEAAR